MYYSDATTMAVVQIVGALTSKDALIMHLLGCLCYYVELHNIHIKAKHVPGVINSVADSLSRNVVHASPHPTPSQGR